MVKWSCERLGLAPATAATSFIDFLEFSATLLMGVQSLTY
jgi:hypothetical protein